MKEEGELEEKQDENATIPVRVGLRVRPLSEKEKSERSRLCIRYIQTQNFTFRKENWIPWLNFALLN